MKCKVSKCDAKCCYNVPFIGNELEKYADKIVTPVVDTTEWSNGAVMPWTVTVGDKSSMLATALAMKKNKCPFLRTDHLCNIYGNRPEICRLYGEIDELKCKYRK